MLLLTEAEVRSCNVLRRNIFEEVALPGVSYQGKLFFRVGEYAEEQVVAAKKDALERLQRTNEALSLLIVQSHEQLTLWQEDPELVSCSESEIQTQRIKQIDLTSLAEKMRAVGGVKICYRLQGLKLHRKTFIAQDAVDWMAKRYDLRPEDALRLAQRMMDEKLIYHVQRQNAFEANGDLYRFYEDELLVSS